MMRLLQALRRSIKGEKEKPQISITPKSAVAIVPPKKVGFLPHIPYLRIPRTNAQATSHHLLFLYNFLPRYPGLYSQRPW